MFINFPWNSLVYQEFGTSRLVYQGHFWSIKIDDFFRLYTANECVINNTENIKINGNITNSNLTYFNHKIIFFNLFCFFYLWKLALAPPALCQLDKDTGPCRAHFQRFFFNKETGKCEEFVYGGCLGNINNFRTKEECEGICKLVFLFTN